MIGSFIVNNIINYNILVFSSLLFVIPAYIAFLYKMYFHCFLTTIVSIFSTYNWIQYKHTEKSLTIDILLARISFIIYFISGCYNNNSNILLIIGIFDGGCCGLFYYIGYRMYKTKFISNIFHFLFHICVIIGKLIVIKSYIDI